MPNKPLPTLKLLEHLYDKDIGGTLIEVGIEQPFFRQGEAADSVYCLKQGRAKIVVVSDQGKEAVIGIIEVGDFFGEQCLSGHQLRVASVNALEDSVAVRLEKQDVVDLLVNDSYFSNSFVSHLVTRNARIEEDLVDNLFNNSEKRLARVLLLLANFGTESPPQPILADISQETLAQMIGTTRPRVSSFMNKFRRMGYVDYNGGLHVHRSLLNVVLRD